MTSRLVYSFKKGTFAFPMLFSFTKWIIPMTILQWQYYNYQANIDICIDTWPYNLEMISVCKKMLKWEVVMFVFVVLRTHLRVLTPMNGGHSHANFTWTSIVLILIKVQHFLCSCEYGLHATTTTQFDFWELFDVLGQFLHTYS